jgi:phage terminase Nu1 subunit (DNA packaging protein)
VKLLLPQIPRQVMESQATAKGDVRFFELAYLDAERARLARAQADKTEIETAERRSKLLPVEDALAAWQKLVTAFRAKYLALQAPEFAAGVMPEPSKPASSQAGCRRTARR